MLKANTTIKYDDKFIIGQLNNLFSKIVVVDNSVDIDKVKKQLYNYYKKKFENLNKMVLHLLSQ